MNPLPGSSLINVSGPYCPKPKGFNMWEPWHFFSLNSELVISLNSQTAKLKHLKNLPYFPPPHTHTIKN